MGPDLKCQTCGEPRAGHTPTEVDGILHCPIDGQLAWDDERDFPGPPAAVPGVGPDAPIVANAAGGKQSHSPYRCDLLPPRATLAVAGVLAHGATKYGPNNWHAIPTGDHVNHALVHLFAFLAGDGQDDHLGHAACRIMMALDQHLSGRAKPAEGGAA
jgi:hypothetical protein